jgi:hypothetical protein
VATPNDREHLVGKVVHITVRHRALRELQVVVHWLVVACRSAVAKAVVRYRERCDWRCKWRRVKHVKVDLH